MSLRNLKMDEQAELDGVWFTFNKSGANFRLRLAHMGEANKAWKTALRNISKKWGTPDGEIRPAEEIAEQRVAFVKHVLKGWEGVDDWRLEDEDEEPVMLPYTKDNAIALLETFEEVWAEALAFAQERDNYRLVRRVQAGKN